jgi:hypothetical protein
MGGGDRHKPGEDDPSDRPKERIERSVRDVMRVRSEVKFVLKGTISAGAKKIVDRRTWE